MPTYEYTCTKCEHAWEEDQSISEDPVTQCPECQEETAKRLISGGTGFLLTGGGWAKEGYSTK
jgi:putative FmdB family regulatory protein